MVSWTAGDTFFKIQRVVILIGVTLCSTQTWAHYGELYGLGIRASSSGLALSTRCMQRSHSAFYNPALLACDHQVRGDLNYAHTVEQLQNIDGVRVSSPTYPARVDQIDTPSGSISTDYPNHQALQVSLEVPVFPSLSFFNERSLKFGFSLHANTDYMMSSDAGYIFRPDYTLYGSRDRRAFISTGLGAQILEDRLWLGMGAQFYFTTGISAVMIYEQSNTAGQTTTNIDPRLGLIVGLRGRPVAAWPLSLSFVFHQGINQKVNALARTDIPISGGGGQPFLVRSEASLYAEPHRLRLGGSWEGSDWSYELQAVLHLWRSVRNSKTQLVFESPTKQSLPMSNRFRNSVSILNGGTYRFQPFELSGGLSWHQGMVEDMTQAENELDTDKVVLSLAFFYDLPWIPRTRVSVGYQHQYLVEKNIAKTDGSYLGSPGFKVGGHVHHVQLGLEYGF